MLAKGLKRELGLQYRGNGMTPATGSVWVDDAQRTSDDSQLL